MIRIVLAAAMTAAILPAAASAASTATLHQREHRQHSTIHRDVGTLRFFRSHDRLAGTPAGRRALRFARAELGWTRRELRETRAALSPVTPSYAAMASWYGPGFYGHRTACGLTLTTSLVGVAHRSLPCGTRLLVCYSGRCVHAAVVDRGPYVYGRDFDLTGGLAVALGFGGVGAIRFQIE